MNREPSHHHHIPRKPNLDFPPSLPVHPPLTPRPHRRTSGGMGLEQIGKRGQASAWAGHGPFIGTGVREWCEF